MKDPIIHKANVIYKETCTCKEFYFRETKRNSEVRWNEHCSGKKTSEVGDNLLANSDHNNITWKTPKQTFKRKILEVFYIRRFKPTLNSQKDIRITHLLGNGITCIPESEIFITNILYVDNISYCNFFKRFHTDDVDITAKSFDILSK